MDNSKFEKTYKEYELAKKEYQDWIDSDKSLICDKFKKIRDTYVEKYRKIQELIHV